MKSLRQIRDLKDPPFEINDTAGRLEPTCDPQSEPRRPTLNARPNVAGARGNTLAKMSDVWNKVALASARPERM
jgi:hypothetical protein